MKHKCWNCANAIADGRCEYILSKKCINGWKAIWNEEYKSYSVKSCPKFKNDQTREILQGDKVKVFVTEEEKANRRKYYLKNREKIKEYAVAYRIKNREKINKQTRELRAKKKREQMGKIFSEIKAERSKE